MDAAGIAGTQGSWFGWYGEDIIDKRVEESGIEVPVYTNDLQLLRAMLNWDNLAGEPLESRSYDENRKIYKSGNNYADHDVIYSRIFDNGGLFAVFRNISGRFSTISGERIAEAWFADELFEKTAEDALSCMSREENVVTLRCGKRRNIGIRIKVADLSQVN